MILFVFSCLYFLFDLFKGRATRFSEGKLTWYPNLSQSPFLSFLSVLFKGQKGQVSFALENLKPVVLPYGKGYQEYPSCPRFTKKGLLFLSPFFCCVLPLPSNTIFVRKTLCLALRAGRDTPPFKKIFFLSTIFCQVKLFLLCRGPALCLALREGIPGRDTPPFKYYFCLRKTAPFLPFC